MAPPGTSANLIGWPPKGAVAQVAREPQARLRQDHVQEPEHSSAAVFNLHLFVASHITAFNVSERVPDVQGREDADVALREHRRLAGAGGPSPANRTARARGKAAR